MIMQCDASVEARVRDTAGAQRSTVQYANDLCLTAPLQLFLLLLSCVWSVRRLLPRC